MTYIIYFLLNAGHIDLFSTVSNIFSLAWTKVVPQLKADQLGSIPTSSQYGLSEKSHDWVEGIG